MQWQWDSTSGSTLQCLTLKVFRILLGKVFLITYLPVATQQPAAPVWNAISVHGITAPSAPRVIALGSVFPRGDYTACATIISGLITQWGFIEGGAGLQLSRLYNYCRCWLVRRRRPPVQRWGRRRPSRCWLWKRKFSRLSDHAPAFTVPMYVTLSHDHKLAWRPQKAEASKMLANGHRYIRPCSSLHCNQFITRFPTMSSPVIDEKNPKWGSTVQCIHHTHSWAVTGGVSRVEEQRVQRGHETIYEECV